LFGLLLYHFGIESLQQRQMLLQRRRYARSTQLIHEIEKHSAFPALFNCLINRTWCGRQAIERSAVRFIINAAITIQS
jgi:hypothetical protein